MLDPCDELRSAVTYNQELNSNLYELIWSVLSLKTNMSLWCQKLGDDSHQSNVKISQLNK